MRPAEALWSPVVDVREVLEPFLADGVLDPRWRETLRAAAAELARLAESPDDDLDALAREVRTLSRGSLDSERPRARRVADRVARLLTDLQVPGMPRPGDPDWAF